MLLWVMREFEKKWVMVWKKWDISRAILILYGWEYKTLQTFPISGWAYCSGCDCRFSIKIIPEWILWVANFQFRFYEICVQNQWRIKFWNPLEDSDTSEPGSITVRMLSNRYLFFNSDIMNFEWKADEGEAKSILLIFVLRWCFHCCQVRGGGMGQKVLFRATRNHIFF